MKVVNLTKKDLASLVRGTSPGYAIFENPLIKKCGRYIGGFKEEWIWNYGFEENLNEDQLWDLYVMCRDSRK